MFSINRRNLRPFSRQTADGDDMRQFHVKVNPLFKGETALYDPTDKDNIVDDIKVNPLHASKMRRELDDEDNSARSHLTKPDPKGHARSRSDVSRLHNEFGVVSRGQVQEVDATGKVVETGPRRVEDDDADVGPRRDDASAVEMSAIKPAVPVTTSTPSPSSSVAASPSVAAGEASVAGSVAGAPGGPAELKADTPAVVSTPITPISAFDDEGPRKPRGFDDDDDGPRKKKMDRDDV
jgi:hypothetical protein